MAKAQKILYSYHGEPYREMTKKEIEKYVKHRKDCEIVYKFFLDNGSITDAKEDMYECLNHLIDLACDMQKKIGLNSDYIRRDMVKKVQEKTSKQISKKLFIDMVNWLKDHNAPLDEELDKVSKKIDKEYTTNLYRQSLKNILYKNYIKYGKIKVPKSQEIDMQKIPEISLEDDKAFEQIIRDCAERRYEIDYVFYPMYKRYAMAAEHISHGDLTFDRFKTLVNYHYYCWTDKKEDPWEAQFNKYTAEQLLMDFSRSYKLCEQYGYDYFFSEIKDYIINQFIEESKQNKNQKNEMNQEIEAA